MKRLLPLALALLLLLSACAGPSEIPSVTTGGETNPPSVTTGGETNPPAVTTGGETTAIETLDPAGLPFQDSAIDCNSKEEYQSAVRSYRMPDHFVTLEDLSDYGSFSFFRYEGGNSYSYNLRDAFGQRVQVLVYHTPCLGFDRRTYSKADNEDLRFLDDKSEKWTNLQIGPVTYRYFGGTLFFLEIQGEYHEISIIGRKKICEYDTTKDTPLSRLLTRSTAEAEAKALLAKIEG